MNSHYEAVLADLRQTKADAEAGIRAIERLMARNAQASEDEATSAPAITAKAKAESNGTSNSGDPSVPTRILELLASQPNHSFSFGEILLGLATVNAKTLRGALARVANKGRIAKPSRGKYRAVRKPATAELPLAS